VLQIVKRDGEELIGPYFIFQQDVASCHTSKKTLEAIVLKGISVILSDDWPRNSPDINLNGYFV